MLGLECHCHGGIEVTGNYGLTGLDMIDSILGVGSLCILGQRVTWLTLCLYGSWNVKLSTCSIYEER